MSILSEAIQKQVEEKLVSDKLVSPAVLQNYTAKSKEKNVPLLALLVQDKIISNEVLTQTIASVTKVPYVNLLTTEIKPEVLDLMPKEVAEHYMAVPLGESNQRLVVAMLDAENIQAVDFLANKIGRPLKVYAASEEGIRTVLAQYASRVDTRLAGTVDTKSVNKEGKEVSTSEVTTPISKILTAILDFAAQNKASDIHIEPHEKTLTVRCRVDGVMREVMQLPKSAEPPLISRVKILSNLKIDEHRVPQDGQFTVTAGGKEIDLRIAISPVVWGEQVVIRLLDKTGTSLKLEDMGFRGRALRTIRKGLERPNGMILTSGPTGSGKSTSLYALLNEIKSESINIVTLEDPVEYKMEGINQIQVNPAVGLTFAAGLRSILRQDPDVVMVGEIRDKETAQLAVQAALTGHLVFSTLHTNSAAGILPRLLDMGIEPFLIASTVHTVIGQRLVRTLAQDSRELYQSDAAETQAIHDTLGGLLPGSIDLVPSVSQDIGYKSLPLSGQNAYTLCRGVDSKLVPGGYRGRMGLYEVFEVTEEIQRLIINRSTSSEINKLAQAQGMISMRQDGYLKALAGQTTLSEVNRVAAIDNA